MKNLSSWLTSISLIPCGHMLTGVEGWDQVMCFLCVPNSTRVVFILRVFTLKYRLTEYKETLYEETVIYILRI